GNVTGGWLVKSINKWYFPRERIIPSDTSGTALHAVRQFRAEDDRRIGQLPGDAGTCLPRRPAQQAGADCRRARHRQGAGSLQAALPVAALAAELSQDQLRRLQ